MDRNRNRLGALGDGAGVRMGMLEGGAVNEVERMKLLARGAQVEAKARKLAVQAFGAMDSDDASEMAAAAMLMVVSSALTLGTWSKRGIAAEWKAMRDVIDGMVDEMA